MNNFKKLILIGEGTYGRVYKAESKENNEVVAIKKIEVEINKGLSFTTIREIKMLKKLRSNHIVRLKDIFLERGFLYLVMEFLPFDLTGLIQSGYRFSESQIFGLSYQLIEATRYIHSLGLIHRDIKSSNILIKNSGVLKLADFGLTREASSMMTNRVCTLWYRAPELLLGVHEYDLKVDSWSIACVILEMKMMRPPFKGSDEISQIKTIFNTLGAPSELYLWSDVLQQQKYAVNKNWEELINNKYGLYFHKEMIKLLCELLRLSPKQRISPSNALKLQFFSNNSRIFIPIDSKEVHEYYCRKNKVTGSKPKF